MPSELKYRPGFYAGTITEFFIDLDDDNEEQPVLCFRVKMTNYEEPCLCVHKCYGNGQDNMPRVNKAKAIVEKLGGNWTDLDTWDPEGKSVRVGVFHSQSPGGSKTFENCYIVIGGKRGNADPKKVTSALSKLTGKVLNEGLPF